MGDNIAKGGAAATDDATTTSGRVAAVACRGIDIGTGITCV